MNRTCLRILVLNFLALILCHSLMAQEQKIGPAAGCKNNPAIVGECFTIHGRLTITNGTPGLRIWRIGTKRILGVLPSEAEILPESVKKHLKFGTFIYGDFVVCPFSADKPGVMQTVCVESASNRVVERYIEGQEKPEVFRIEQ